LIKLEFSQLILEKSSNMKFHKNTPNASRVVSHEQRNMTKLTVAFRSLPNTAAAADTEGVGRLFSWYLLL
jgi:hypothetical protein